MKKTMFMLAIFLVTAVAAQAQVRIGMDVILGKRAPTRTEASAMRREELAHPRITRSMNDIANAINELKRAPDNFGGHKADAMAALENAYQALRRALFYRLYSDRH